MLDQKKLHDTIDNSTTGTKVGPAYLCLHGHFYQPPREDPFTGQQPIEPSATPYANFNEKITSECYHPNAEAGNFEAINYDLGPTLAAWLEVMYPDVYQRIIDADRKHLARYGVGNAMAQSYNHTILPLATSRDKRTQILWGLSDFRYRYGREATGLWLPETAVDLESLDLLAQNGIIYTVLAPWQAATPIAPSEPYLVRLPGGRRITVFFFNAPLSGGVSFDWNMTENADLFAASYLPGHLMQSKRETGEAQLTHQLLEAQYYQQCSFTSCGLFFEDLDRIEPRNNIAFARRSISLIWQALGIDLQPGFVSELRAVKSWRVPLTGADVYRQLPIIGSNQLPSLPLSLLLSIGEEENVA